MNTNHFDTAPMTVNRETLEVGQTVATIPSIAAGTRTRIVGKVVSLDRFEIRGVPFVTVLLETDCGAVSHTSMSGEYEVVS
jgi:hypothetical protein